MIGVFCSCGKFVRTKEGFLPSGALTHTLCNACRAIMEAKIDVYFADWADSSGDVGFADIDNLRRLKALV